MSQGHEIKPAKGPKSSKEVLSSFLRGAQESIHEVQAVVRNAVPKPSLTTSEIMAQATALSVPHYPRQEYDMIIFPQNIYFELIGFDPRLLTSLGAVMHIVDVLDQVQEGQNPNEILSNMRRDEISQVAGWRGYSQETLYDIRTSPEFRYVVRQAYQHVARHLDTLSQDPRLRDEINSIETLVSAIVSSDAYVTRSNFTESLENLYQLDEYMESDLKLLKRTRSSSEDAELIAKDLGANTIHKVRATIADVKGFLGIDDDTIGLIPELPASSQEN